MADPVGEDGWLALVDEASRIAGDLEQRVGVVELYKRAIAAEPWSIKVWLAYCEWVWSLYTDCQTADAGWPEEEQLLGQELFSLEMALDVWQQGAQATQYRLNDSHELWNRWISIELEQLSKSRRPEIIERVRSIFLDRLQIPHASWNETSQMFSTFLTKYDERSWEETMVQATQLAKTARALFSQREEHELALQRAAESGDGEAQQSVMREYLEWEVGQSKKKGKKGVVATPSILSIALYERALSSTTLSSDPSTWEDYIGFLSSPKDQYAQTQSPTILSVCQRATGHCPWSGTLWARYMICAESENLPFSDIEQIKHAATSGGVLDRDGMAAVVEVYIAWCGYLRRRTLSEEATDEDIDIADVGLRSSLESVQDWGQRRYGKEYLGDPSFGIERILIQYLTQKGSVEEAREYWEKLVDTHAGSYEFWLQYYLWEMTVRGPNGLPSLATAVLIQAVHRKQLDWPEKMMESYIRHCTDYEDSRTLLTALDTVFRLAKGVARRRQREAAETAAIYAQQKPEALAEDADTNESPSGASKRKRESTPDELQGSKKKLKNGKHEIEEKSLQEQKVKRDRENTTILATNLPADATQTKVRQYFKEYGHIVSITLKTEMDKLSSTALIEFDSNEDVQSALLRDGKYFNDKQIHVEAGTGLTLYVTNYPPTADEDYLRNLFKDCGEIFAIRWPSLKYNSHRRFCYVSFRTHAAAAAATELDGQTLDNYFKLVAKYSDPTNKNARHGATAEGRELHITGIDFTLTEDDLREVFSKYGKVEHVRLLKTMTGGSKGAGFVGFGNKADAEAALCLDNTKLKSRVLKVEVSLGKNFKRTSASTGVTGSSAFPAPDADGDSVMSASPAPEIHHANTHGLHGPSKTEIGSRTITLMNIPDTFNDSRIRVIAERYGNIVKIVLRLDHQGAIIEFADVAAAGRAALGLENYEIEPGRKLRTGGLKDLFNEKDEIKTDRISKGQGEKASTNFITPTAPIRRPGPGGRGGLGIKRGLGYSAPKPAAAPLAGSGIGGSNGDSHEGKGTKSNADFKAMFLSAGKQ